MTEHADYKDVKMTKHSQIEEIDNWSIPVKPSRKFSKSEFSESPVFVTTSTC